MPEAPQPWTAGCGAGSWSARVRNQLWRVERGGAGAVAVVAVTVRTGPFEAAAAEHRVAPGCVGLEPVVTGAQAGQVVAGGGSGLVATLAIRVVVVGDDVVELTTSGWPRALGKTHVRRG